MNKIFIFDHFCPDKSFFEISVNHSGRLRCRITNMYGEEGGEGRLLLPSSPLPFPRPSQVRGGARAHNRRHAHKLMDVGVDKIFRDTLLSSLAMGESVLVKLGFDDNDVRHVSDTFRDADEKLLLEQHALQDSEDKLIQSAKDAAWSHRVKQMIE